MEPLLILAIGIFTIIFMIAALRVNAFLALLTSAIIVSLLAPGEFADKKKKRLESVLASAPDWFWQYSTFLQTYANDTGE